MEKLETLDRELKNVRIVSNTNRFYSAMRLRVIIAVVLSTMLIVCVIVADVITFDPLYPTYAAIGDTVIYRVTLTCTTYMLLQFCAFLEVIRQMYKWLNRYIKTTAETCKKQNSFHTQNLPISM